MSARLSKCSAGTSASNTPWRRTASTVHAEVLFDYAESSSDPDAPLVAKLVVVRNQQRVFSETVEQYLRLIDYADDGYARLSGSRGTATRKSSPTRHSGRSANRSFLAGEPKWQTFSSVSGPVTTWIRSSRSSGCPGPSSKT